MATDLARFPKLRDWSTEDLNILASLFVNSMIIIAEALEDATDAAAVEEITRTATKQLRMIAVGIDGWRATPARRVRPDAVRETRLPPVAPPCRIFRLPESLGMVTSVTPMMISHQK